jgi:hypothetical protein
MKISALCKKSLMCSLLLKLIRKINKYHFKNDFGFFKIQIKLNIIWWGLKNSKLFLLIKIDALKSTVA